jgi:hypothetical protein
MDLRYMGFDHKQNTRTYKFDRTEKGEPSIRLAVTADLALFLKHRIGIQEGPTLCAHKLTADLDGLREGDHELTNDDLQAYVSDRAAAELRRAESRRSGIRPKHLAKPSGAI